MRHHTQGDRPLVLVLEDLPQPHVQEQTSRLGWHAGMPLGRAS